MKYFEEKANNYHIAAAGSLLGVKISRPKSFPVGKVNFLDLYPMTFFEFLDAIGHPQYRHLLEKITQATPLSEPFHETLVDLLKKYFLIGGMPEAVKVYALENDFMAVRQVQLEILNSYILDFAKHAQTHDIPKLSKIWESVPIQLARENKKFIFSAIRKSARAREYEDAFQWLEDAGLILRAPAITTARQPLRGYEQSNAFKIYALDVGILGAMASLPLEMSVMGNKLYTEYKGAFVENYVAQQLTSALQQKLYYWRSRGGTAELDFLYEHNNHIFPLEVKAGINPKSKSLQSIINNLPPRNFSEQPC